MFRKDPLPTLPAKGEGALTEWFPGVGWVEGALRAARAMTGFQLGGQAAVPRRCRNPRVGSNLLGYMLLERNRRYLGRCDADRDQEVGAMQPLGIRLDPVARGNIDPF
jgi:hypothetical protein